MAQPMYPAAYPEVVAVTATDDRGRAFRLANRGEYVDIAAPGVNIRHAQAGGGFAASSGTSYAVPFVSAVSSRRLEGPARLILITDTSWVISQLNALIRLTVLANSPCCSLWSNTSAA